MRPVLPSVVSLSRCNCRCYYCSFIKLGVTLVKYIPQIAMNHSRQSTEGWSIDNVLLDLSGGVLSVAQLLIACQVLNDWQAVTGECCGDAGGGAPCSGWCAAEGDAGGVVLTRDACAWMASLTSKCMSIDVGNSGIFPRGGGEYSRCCVCAVPCCVLCAGNPIKFGLGLVSIGFDVIFMLQHYVWFHPEKTAEATAAAAASKEQLLRWQQEQWDQEQQLQQGDLPAEEQPLVVSVHQHHH